MTQMHGVGAYYLSTGTRIIIMELGHILLITAIVLVAVGAFFFYNNTASTPSLPSLTTNNPSNLFSTTDQIGQATQDPNAFKSTNPFGYQNPFG